MRLSNTSPLFVLKNAGQGYFGEAKGTPDQSILCCWPSEVTRNAVPLCMHHSEGTLNHVIVDSRFFEALGPSKEAFCCNLRSFIKTGLEWADFCGVPQCHIVSRNQNLVCTSGYVVIKTFLLMEAPLRSSRHSRSITFSEGPEREDWENIGMRNGWMKRPNSKSCLTQ